MAAKHSAGSSLNTKAIAQIGLILVCLGIASYLLFFSGESAPKPTAVAPSDAPAAEPSAANPAPPGAPGTPATEPPPSRRRFVDPGSN